MRYIDLPYFRRALLYTQYKAGSDFLDEAATLGVRPSSLKRALRRFGTHLVEESPKPRLDKPPTIGDCLILADIHAPYHDSEFINRCIDAALRGGVEECCIAGDLVDNDALSPFDPRAENILEEEYQSAGQLLDILAHAFRRVLRIKGNHDARLDKRLGFGQLSADRVRQMLTKATNVEFSDYYVCYSGQWMVVHPKNVSVVPGAVAARLAGKYHCNVVAGHGHVFGLAQDVSGQYIGIDSGACVDPLRLEYVSARPNLRPAIVQGAVVLREGYPYLLSKWFNLDGLFKR